MATTPNAFAAATPSTPKAASPIISFLRKFPPPDFERIWLKECLLRALLANRLLDDFARYEVEVAFGLPKALALLGRHNQRVLLLALLDRLCVRDRVDRPDRGIRRTRQGLDRRDLEVERVVVRAILFVDD